MREVDEEVTRMSELEKCLECGLCSQECELLREIDESPKKIAERGAVMPEAFSCALCGACEAVCPVELSPKSLFAAGRRQAVASGEMDLGEYVYLMPDHENNMMRVYRDFYSIDYRDIEADGPAGTCFFPGCTLMTYAPELTRAVYAQLQKSCGCEGMIGECCGKPLSLLGAAANWEQAAGKLIAKLKDQQVRELIVACPGCYYELKELLASVDIRVRTVYEVLGGTEPRSVDGWRYTVHDSCPDRFDGRFGRQVRELLQNHGFSLTEMAHNRQHTLCCGSGGMISTFRPDLTEVMVKNRIDEATKAGAEIMVGYCLSCVMKFADAEDGPVVRHALSLLLGRNDDFVGVRGKASQIKEGKQSE